MAVPGCRGSCCEQELRRGGHERCPGAGMSVPEAAEKARLTCLLKNLARNSPASLSNLEIGSLKFCGFRGSIDNGLRGITCEIWGRDWYMAEEAVL